MTEDQNTIPFTDSYDIARNHFKDLVDEHVSSWTISEEEIKQTKMSTRGQSENPIWFEKRKSILTASNFGKACHNLRMVFNLSMYITNIIPHGKCFEKCLHTCCFVSEILLVRFAHLFDF